jgi:acetolactate synthase-1/2/3 large subunit
MSTVGGGELFVRALKAEGVKYIFTLCGGHLNPIYNACIGSGVEIIDVRHEQSAAHAAAGWARTTGEAGVAVVTAGPGVTDSVSGIAEAFTSNCPVVEFGGRAPLADADRGAMQEVDQVRLMEPITKWAKTIYEARRIPEYVSMAFRQAKSGTPGPVYIDCALDILLSHVEESQVRFPRRGEVEAQGGGSPSQIAEAVQLLMEAKRPVVVVGDGVFWSRAGEELKEFVELTDIPVHFAANFAQGAIPADHRLALGPVSAAMADVVLTLGVTFDFLTGFGQPPMYDAQAKFIQVNVDASAINYNRDADLGIVGTPKMVLRQMIAEVKGSHRKVSRSAWLTELGAIAQTMAEQGAAPYGADSLPIHPARLAREVMEFLDKNAIIVVDGGDNSGGWFSPLVKPRFMGQLMSSGTLGCLGSGIGFALAAKLAHRQRQVLLYSGDGTFGLHGMEFDTFVRHDLPIVAVVANDGAWGMVKHWQVIDYGAERCVGTKLKPRQRYDKVVEALGGYGEYVDRIEDIKPALDRAFASGLPACVNVDVDPNPVSFATTWLKETWRSPLPT